MEVQTKRRSDEWTTPQYVFDGLNEEFHFTLDAAATAENAKCPKFYTRLNDGLEQSWKNETVFVNPPYSALKKWIAKAHLTSETGTTVVMLIPARTDTAAFHDYIYKKPNVEIRFIRGRLRFSGSKQNAPFPSMVVVFRPH